jgi:hypothetical protein
MAESNVVSFPGEPEHQPARPRGTQALAVLIILLRGLVELARIAAVAGLFLLAALGALTLLGR